MTKGAADENTHFECSRKNMRRIVFFFYVDRTLDKMGMGN